MSNREPIEHVKVLCAEIGPRGPTTDAEARASAYAASKLKEIGACDVSVETFRSVPSLWWALEIASALAPASTIVFVLTAGRFWGVSTLLCLATLYVIAAEFSFWDFSLSNLLLKRISQNVYGKIPPKGNPQKKLVVIGHVDTNRTPMLFHPRVVKYLGFMIVLVIVLVAMKLLAFVSSAATQLYTPALVFSFICDIPIVIGLVVLVHGDLFSPFTEGANDNATGAAVALSLAEHLAREPLEQTECWTLCTGCEEATLTGIKDFLKQHGEDLKDACFVDLECLGIGHLRYVTYEGMLTKYYSNPGLVAVAAKAAQAVGNPCIQPIALRLGYTETAIVLRNGFKGITIMAFPEGKEEVPHWHQASDRIANIDPENLDRAVRFLEVFVRELDSE